MDQLPTFLIAGRFQRPNRGRDALGPGSRLGRAWCSGPRASRPRTARGACPLQGENLSQRFAMGPTE